MARLNEPKRKGFSPHDFEAFPVWTWDDEMEGYLPIEGAYPSTEEYGTLFIRAKLFVEGRIFDGYLMGGASFFGFGIFASGREFVFNLNLPDLNRGLVTELEQAIHMKFQSFFPIEYSSDVQLANGATIAGSFP